MTLDQFLLALFSGIGLGSMYALVAASYTLVLAGTGVFSFVQGSIVMLGAVFSFVLGTSLSLPTVAVVPLIFVGGIVAGGVTYLTSLKTVSPKSRHPGEAAVISTLGLALLVESVTANRFGPDARRVERYISPSPVEILGAPVQRAYIVMFVVMVAVLGLLELVMRRTELGVVLRASLESAEGAQLLGIDTRRSAAVVLMIAGAVAAVVGWLVAPITFASPYMAERITLFGFVAMGIGGFGSFAGAIVGGLLVGVIQQVVPILWGPSAPIPILYATVLLVLVIRPRGLFGQPGAFGNTAVREI